MTDSEHKPEIPSGSEDPILPVRPTKRHETPSPWYHSRVAQVGFIFVVCIVAVLFFNYITGPGPEKPTPDTNWHEKHDSLLRVHEALADFWVEKHKQDSIQTQLFISNYIKDSIPYETSNINSLILRIMDADSGAEFIIGYLGQVDSVRSGFDPYQLRRIVPASNGADPAMGDQVQ